MNNLEVGKVYYGYQMPRDIKYYKLTNFDERHNGLQ